MEQKDYVRTEVFCKEKIRAEKEYYWTRTWYELLFEIYTAAENQTAQIALSHQLRVKEKGADYYCILKKLLTESGKWGNEYPKLPKALFDALPFRAYMKILYDEGENELLLEQLRLHPDDVFNYAAKLSKRYPADIYSMCVNVLRKAATQTGPRSKYQSLFGGIKKLFRFGGRSEALAIIDELKNEYPSCPAMGEELDALWFKLEKK